MCLVLAATVVQLWDGQISVLWLSVSAERDFPMCVTHYTALLSTWQLLLLLKQFWLWQIETTESNNHIITVAKSKRLFYCYGFLSRYKIYLLFIFLYIYTVAHMITTIVDKDCSRHIWNKKTCSITKLFTTNQSFFPTQNKQ